MLMSIGPLGVEIAPFNVHETDTEHEEDFAWHDVLGARRLAEHVGEGDEQIRLYTRLFPEKLGGLGALELLKRIKGQAVPHLIVRGDGKPLGFFLVTRLRETGRYIDRRGVGRLIEVDTTLERAEQPSPQSMFNTIMDLFSL